MSESVPFLLLFDCDGTLVDSQHLLVSAMSDAYREQGLEPPPREVILSVVGLSLPETFIALSRGDPDFPIETLVTGYKTAFFRLRESHPTEPMFPGVRDAVEILRGEVDTLLGIATGKSQRGVRRVLEAHAMEGWFSSIQTADDAPSKPHPAMVRQAMAELGGTPPRTLVIGDTSYDMEMAKAAGAWALGVNWGYHTRDELVAAGADMLVDAPADLVEAVRALMGRADR
ncbi:HAD-IA family hydrolase [Aquabacter cavernae]|uniref:HAD-IA family hydrolase n=1 Tax=Aquabacter cavernae TaxID=2496029 RepID=UPI000F8CDE0E|nr:HAD-IA family hydrolase [Aquabacter cavernae]